MRSRIALGVAWSGMGMGVSYVLQRLYAAFGGDLDSMGVIASAHIPYYWRVNGALLQGLVVGVLVAGFVRHPTRALERSTRVAWFLIPLLMIASLAVP